MQRKPFKYHRLPSGVILFAGRKILSSCGVVGDLIGVRGIWVDGPTIHL